MEGITDCAFRTLCYNNGADLTFTEMIRVDALNRKNKSTAALLDLKNETPTGIQLLTVKPTEVQKFVDEFSTYNIKPVQIDINASCPSPDVIRVGSGAALIKRTNRINELITILRKLNLPVSIKMRTGLNDYEQKHKVYLNVLKNVDADAFIIHARHARASSQEKADWSVFEECFATGKHIVPNGDICEPEHVNFFKQLGAKEVMIGRAALRNPSVFNYLKGKEKLDMNLLKKEYLQLSQKFAFHPKYRESVMKGMN